MQASPEKCRVCSDPSLHVFTLPLLGRATAYFDCKNCGYLQTQSPYWLEEAYAHAINDVDTGIMWRNRVNVGRVIMTLLAYGRLNGRVIDHAGGYGILVRLLRDAGVEAEWRDKYCQNMLARGFEATDENCDLLTAFEVIEHMVEPVAELRQMLNAAPVVLVSTELVPTPNTPPSDWWYLGPEHGQHIGFFRLTTLRWIATKLGYYFASDGASVHVFSRRPIAVSWGILQRLRRLWPIVARVALTPKFTSDFYLLREKQLGVRQTPK
jgi:hypothetical protein